MLEQVVKPLSSGSILPWLTASRIVTTNSLSQLATPSSISSDQSVTLSGTATATVAGLITAQSALTVASAVTLSLQSASRILTTNSASAVASPTAISTTQTLTLSTATGTTLTLSSTDTTAALSSAGCVRALSFRFSTGVRFAIVNGSYHQIYTQADNSGLLLGGSGDPNNYYRNTGHIFGSIGGATTIMSMDTATGLVSITSGTQSAAGSGLQVARTNTSTSGSNFASLAVHTANPAGASSANVTGMAGNVTLAAGASGISGSITGMDGAVDADATTNTFANVVALRGTLRKGGANTLTIGTAVEASVSTTAAGTISTAHGFYLSAMSNSGGATITTAYGLRLANVAIGSTNYAIFTGTGLVSFGDTTTSASVLLAGGMQIATSKNLRMGTAAIATNATDGFLYVSTCAGTPTGTPTTLAGTAPIVIDTTNNKLYFYSGGAWRDAGP